MDLVDIMLIAGGSRDMETFETVLETLLFIESDHGHSTANSEAESAAEDMPETVQE